jgi:hypothetical protein
VPAASKTSKEWAIYSFPNLCYRAGYATEYSSHEEFSRRLRLTFKWFVLFLS